MYFKKELLNVLVVLEVEKKFALYSLFRTAQPITNIISATCWLRWEIALITHRLIICTVQLCNFALSYSLVSLSYIKFGRILCALLLILSQYVRRRRAVSAPTALQQGRPTLRRPTSGAQPVFSLSPSVCLSQFLLIFLQLFDKKTCGCISK